MPSRKSIGGSSMDTNNERGSTLRRLSSMASFHGIFVRRRSHFPPSSSNLSLESTVVNPPVPQTRIPSTAINASVNEATNRSIKEEQPSPSPPSAPQLLPQTAQGHGSSSYINPPSEVTNDRKPPRSRTFSNLPLPVRSRKTTPRQTLSEEHSWRTFAEPSQNTPLATRLPTPTASTRRYSQGRFPSLGRIASLVPSKARVQRSDTEPLLGAPRSDMQQRDGRRSSIVAKKENVALNAAQRLSMISICEGGEEVSSTTTKLGIDRVATTGRNNDIDKDRNPHRLVLDLGQTQSSPLLKSIKDQQTPNAETKNERMQRWISQPILANVTNRRNSRYGEIKHTRLLAVRQAPTPPLPTTPMLSPAIKKQSHSSLISLRSSGTNTRTPRSSPRLGTEQARLSNPERKKQALRVFRAEPSSYWAGRLISLMDQYRNAELVTLLEIDYCSAKAKAERDHSARSDVAVARFRRAFAQLHAFCVTSDARHSLTVFQRSFAEMAKIPDLGVASSSPRTIERMGRFVVGGGGRKKKGAGEVGGESGKGSIVERFLSKQKRRSFILV